MRARLVVFSLLLAASTGVTPAVVSAQGDFGDEFDDEFGPLPPPPGAPAAPPQQPSAPVPPPPGSSEPAPPPPAPPPPASSDEFDDEFGAPPATDSAPPQQSPAGGASVETGASTDDSASLTTESVTVTASESTGDATTAAATGPVADEDEELRAQRFRVHNTYLGATGGLHVVDAASGPRGTFRLALMTEVFRSGSFLDGGDTTRFGGALSLSWSAHENIEVYGAIQSYATSSSDSDPNLIQVLGDTHLGIKGFHWVLPFLAVGGDIDLNLLNRVGDIGVVLRSTSLGLRANLTADLRELESEIPLVMRFNARYWMDNSSQLVENTEDARYLGIEDPLPREDERRHLLTAGERFALEMNRTDFFDISLGFEAPLQAAEDFYISPLLEWNWRIPLNRQGYDCVFIPDPGRPGRPEDGDDGCLKNEGVSAFPMTLSLGARVLPPIRGLALTVAADVGLTGRKDFVRELAPTQPYNIYLGASYAYDTRPQIEVRNVEVERVVEIGQPRGRVRGTIVEQGTETVVPNAIVRFPGREESAILAAQDGTFVSYLFDPGDVEMAIEHEEYHPGSCSATVPAPPEGTNEDSVVEIRCELEALPRRGDVNGTVRDEDGPVAGATLAIEGPESRSVTSDASGRFELTELPPGAYQVRIESEDHLIKLAEFTVIARETVTPEILLLKRPRRSMVRLTRRAIVIRRQINFATNSDEILEQSYGLMEEIADLMIRNPQLEQIEIQGHTDDRGGRDHNQDLSQRRADAVRNWLVAHGVEASRLEAVGYGQTRPLVPNITSSNRARNRRVQFVVTEREEE